MPTHKPMEADMHTHAPARDTESSVAGAKRAQGDRRPHLSTAVRLARWRLATDALMLVFAATVETLSASAADLGQNPAWRLVFIGIVLCLLAARGLYRASTSQRFLDDARTILSVTAVAAMLITFLRVLFADQSDIANEAIRWWLFAVVYLVAGRGALLMITDRFNRFGRSGAPTLILGAGRVAHLVASRLLAHPELGLRPIGFVDRDPLDVEQSSGLPVLGSDQELEQLVREHDVEHAIVSFSRVPHDTELELARALRRMRISISIIPRLFEGTPDRITLERVEGLPLVTIHPSDPRDWRVSLKYASDRLLALLAILLVSPLLVLAALGTAFTLGFPILFRQRRVGLDGRGFEMLKFRTMTGSPEEHGEADAEWAARAARGESGPDNGDETVPAEARRTTVFGAFLRRMSFDELPQLFNVLRGEMSMVGPRPERTSYVEMFKDRIRRYSDRHQVKAGITGWAQVNGLRGDTSLADRIEWDNYYIENWSPWLDLKIMLLTVLTFLRGRSS
jgi:exopolysaccharide biosynthesis polyprenyl glycosylphosphotransferase